MRKFVGQAENEAYRVGCTGQTVYVYNVDGAEVARFRDIIYAYTPLFRPNSNVVVVKSNEGRIAVYDLDRKELVKKFRTCLKATQDTGMCFSEDGKLFLDIEMQGDLLCDIVTYDAESFEEISRFRAGYTLWCIEYGDGGYYVLGYTRRNDGCFQQGFVAFFNGIAFREMRMLPKELYEEIYKYKRCEIFGFTEFEIALRNYTLPDKPIVLSEIFAQAKNLTE